MESRKIQGKIRVDSEVDINVRDKGDKPLGLLSRNPVTKPNRPRSVVSSITAKSASQLLKERLLEPNSFSASDVILLIENAGIGTDLKTSLAISRNFTENINGMKIMIPNSKGITDREKGKYITDCIVNMIVQGGEVLVGIVATNFDLTAEYIDARASVTFLECQRDELTLDIFDPVPVDKQYHDAALIEAEETLKDELLSKYREAFDDRVAQSTTRQPMSVTSSTSDDTASKQSSPSDTSSATPVPLLGSLTWENSAEEVQFNRHYTSEQSLLVKEHRREFLTASKEYQAAIKLRNESRIKLATVKAELEKAQVFENRLSELTRQQNQIVSALKTALGMSNTAIIARLNLDVVVSSSRISAPYDNNSLSGIFQNLYNEYNKVSLHYFCDFLLKVLDQSMTSKEADETPGAAVDKIAGFIQEYDRLQLDKHLTSDMLFTAALLKMYPAGSKAQREGLQVVLEESLAMEQDPTRSERTVSTPWPEMHLFSTLAHWEKEIHGKYVEFAGGRSSEKQNRPTGKDKAGVLEDANYAGVGKVSKLREASGPYDREVHRSENLGITVRNGVQYPYIATQSPCHECPHKPRCCTFLCTKCNMFGHSLAQCRQRPSPSQGGGGKPT